MKTKSMHWSERKADPNIKRTGFYSQHINRPRIDGQTILNMLTLKAELMGSKLDVLAEAERFEQLFIV